MDKVAGLASLLAEAEACLLPLAQATSLPAGTYSDPEWYDAERERLFHSGWVAVARSSEVAEPFQFVTANIAGEPVVVVRRRDGDLVALSNVCPHRSSTIVGEAAGTDRTLQCSYHLWTFNLDGQLKAAPGMDQVEGFDPSAVCLAKFAVHDWHGFVLVNIDVNAASYAETAPTLDALFVESRIGECVSVGKRTYPSPWNWKITVENFLESYHHRGIHPETLEWRYPGLQSFVTLEGDEPWSGIDHVSVAEDHEPFIALAAYPSLLIAIERGVGMLWFRAEPRSVDHTDLTIEALVIPELADEPGIGAAMMDSVENINNEDIGINKRTAEGMRSKFASPGRVSHLEGSPWHFRQWIVRQLNQ